MHIIDAHTAQLICGVELQVTGNAKYTDDMLLPPGGLHAALVFSTRPHARILAVDAAKALQVGCQSSCLPPLRVCISWQHAYDLQGVYDSLCHHALLRLAATTNVLNCN